MPFKTGDRVRRVPRENEPPEWANWTGTVTAEDFDRLAVLVKWDDTNGYGGGESWYCPYTCLRAG